MLSRSLILTGMVLSLATQTDAAIEVMFSGPDGTLAHQALRTSSTDSAFFGDLYNNTPVIPPFMGPANNTRHPTDPEGFSGRYTAYDGIGAVEITPTASPMPPELNTPLPYADLTVHGHGYHLSNGDAISAHVGTLGAAMDLTAVGGPLLAMGTQIFSDFHGLVIDYNDPASYWHDSVNNVDGFVAAGGEWGFYYEDPLNSGEYLLLAAYTDVTWDATTDYDTNTTVIQWSATPVVIDGVNLLLPASGSSSGDALSLDGVFNGERYGDFIGFYGLFNSTFTIEFDVDNAVQVVPEPSSLALAGMFGAGALLRMRRSRRRNLTTRSTSA